MIEAVEFQVVGLPATKGSTRSFVSKSTGRLVTISDSRPALKTWTKAVQAASLAARLPKLQGAVAVDVEFRLPRPLKPAHDQPVTRPDVDKLARALLDALAGIAFEDDGQVTEMTTCKRYAPGRDGLPITTVRIGRACS